MNTSALAAVPRFQTDPHAVIVAAVTAAEPNLEASVVGAVVGEVAPTRPALRRLARALHDDPALLTSGRPEGPRLVESLIDALRQAGALNLASPCCARCHRPGQLRRLHEGQRICAPCASALGARRAVCASCQQDRVVDSLDAQGRTLCARCARAARTVDYTALVVDRLIRLDTGLDTRTLHNAVVTALPKAHQQRAVSGELDTQPALLGTNPADGSHRLVLLAETLLAGGARHIATPACPFCRRPGGLRFGRDGRRCCKTCYETARAEDCTRCGHRRPVASRTPDDRPLCKPCADREPVNHERCPGCGRQALLKRASGEQRLCRACWRAPQATCSICGKAKPCHRANTGAPRCESCSRRLLNRHPCSHCATTRVVFARTMDGEPLCQPCAGRRERCNRCQRVMRVVARLPDGPRCGTCWKREPAAERPCIQCGNVERLHHFGLCDACACPEVLRGLLSQPDGTMRPAAQAVFDVLTGEDPTAVLKWLVTATPRMLLSDLAGRTGPLTHDTIGQLRPVKGAARLRDILVAGGALPPRDEYLARLEDWLDTTIAAISDVAEQRLVRRFATWHYLRRLRQRSAVQPMSYGQLTVVRGELQAVARLLTWLRARDRTLATATQTDLDEWLTTGPASCRAARTFVAWAVRRGYADRLDIPLRQNPKRRQVFPEADQRWAITRRLLHDDTLHPVDRVAGLLVLLYAQPVSRIVRLTVDHVSTGEAGTHLALGRKPVHLPTPLDDLVGQLVTRRHGFAVVGRITDHPWLFPGGAPGRPLSAARLVQRLLPLGLQARLGRNTALMDLAAQLPAAVLSQLLGLHITTATEWTQEAGNTRPAYAAEVARQTADPGQG